MRILLVEDETKTGEYLKQGLTEAGYTTDWVKDGLAGHHHALSEDYDLVILDVMLPEISGWQVLAAIRRAGKSMPVLFLTARDQVEDRVKGLELGADDYLVKPFAFAELLARVRAVLRRTDPTLERLRPLDDYPLVRDGGGRDSFSNIQATCAFRSTSVNGKILIFIVSFAPFKTTCSLIIPFSEIIW